MALEQDIAELVTASNNLTQVVDNKIQNINSEVVHAKNKFDNWLNTRHVGFSLVDSLLDHSNDYITIPPRFKTIEEAEAFRFNTADDYAPTDETKEIKYYADVYLKMPGSLNWFSEPSPTQFTGKKSAYGNIAIGTLPHPNPKSVNRMALLMNRIGAHHQWMTTPDPIPNYSQPRVLFNNGINANREVKGQSWGITNYDDLMAFHENEAAGSSPGFSTVRVINLGPYPMHLKGFWIVNHGYQKEIN